MMVSAGWAYSACMPNGAWTSNEKWMRRSVCVRVSFCECVFTHGELMVDFVDVFVDPAMMQQPMQEVVPGVFNHSAAKTLNQNIRPGEGDQRRTQHQA